MINLPTASNRTEITVSDHPGQTFMIESSEYYLEPGQTYGGQWGKHEKYIKVLCFVSGYQWEKKDWKYVKFKVVGRGVTRLGPDATKGPDPRPDPPQNPATNTANTASKHLDWWNISPPAKEK